MENDIKVWLSDIQEAINQIFEFLPEDRNFLKFQSDLKTRKAVERNLEIIGEAVNRILKKDTQLNITNARRIVDTRNRIIHGYDSVSVDIIWSIIVRELPKLQKEIDALLDS